MLTQIVGAYIHNFHGIQSRAPVMGIAAGMGRYAPEMEFS
jgi:hypothetical protein